MKKYNILIPLVLGVAFMSCSNKKNLEKNVLSIETGHLKQLYKGNEDIKLSLKTTENAQVDSVVYFFNDKKIGASLKNDVLNLNLKQQKLGKTVIKAVAYADTANKEFTTNIEITAPNAPAFYTYKIVNTFPHDQEAYTQGLEFYNGILYESTGNGEGGGTTQSGRGTGKKGISSVRQVDYKTGKIIKIHNQPANIFGEGCTILNNKLYQLTYQNNEAYVFNPETLVQEKTLPYFQKMEGWGLTNDGKHLYMTGGTEFIYKLDPETFKEIDRVSVYTDKNAIPLANEMEWVDGKIYANFYAQNAVAVIDPTTGAIEAVIDFSNLVNLTTYHDDRDVMNGIAYNPQTKTFFLTGKNWDKMFEVQIIK